MNVAKQLYQLQKVDQELESTEQAIKQVASQLGESQAVVEMQSKFNMERQHLEGLRKQQHTTEWDIENLVAKLKATEDDLYSGKIKNPKELSSLQQEVDSLKIRRSQLEDKALETMEQVEITTESVATINQELKLLEAEWQKQQKQLSAKMEQLETEVAELKDKLRMISDRIDPQTIDFYRDLKNRKGFAVAKVEQGVCSGCRITLAVTELQKVRSSSQVLCSSCGRILFLA